MKRNKKGFTLAELLIVVAIIAVLVAIAIPVFTGSLKKAHLATNQANARAAYAAATTSILAKNDLTPGTYYYDVKTGKLTDTSTAGTTYESTTSAIADWTIDILSGAFGDKTYNSWMVEVNADGQATQIGFVKGT